jgi:hypothetical protein
MKQDEHNLQMACVNWFRLQYPKLLIYAIPNGGQRNAIVAAKMKAEGVLSGVPDLHIPVAKGRFHGLYIEMKAGKNKPTENQRTVMQKLQDEGYKCDVCYSFDNFVSLVNEYLRL